VGPDVCPGNATNSAGTRSARRKWLPFIPPLTFCVDFHENSPSATTSFTLRSPDSTLECISSGSMASELPIAATQAAVWMYTDRVTFDEMASHFSVSPNNWNAGLKVAAACGVIAGR